MFLNVLVFFKTNIIVLVMPSCRIFYWVGNFDNIDMHIAKFNHLKFVQVYVQFMHRQVKCAICSNQNFNIAKERSLRTLDCTRKEY